LTGGNVLKGRGEGHSQLNKSEGRDKVANGRAAGVLFKNFGGGGKNV